MPHDDDPNGGGSTDTHDALLVQDPPPSPSPKKVDEVGVVSAVDQQLQEEVSDFRSGDPKDHGSPAESSRGPSFSTTADHTSETGSVQSMPAVRISESPTPLASDHPSPAPSPAASVISHRPPPSPARSQTLQEQANSSQTQLQRRARHRSVMLEGRSANRLSGFFNNLMNRRDTLVPNARDAVPEVPSSHPPSRNQSAPPSEPVSRPTSPSPPPRPATPPPPSLPAPTLTELGLSLSTVTSDLSPSHFSAPPTSGAFLAPHYLLLCHAQGLDVLPLSSPPAPQPYALVRRVSFKNVVVMEQRGVLVAIAGRRDGVRVYALEEVKKAIEWRIEVEIKRERDRLRRENVKKSATVRSIDAIDLRELSEKPPRNFLSTPPPGETDTRRPNILRKSSHGSIPVPVPTNVPPQLPLIPRPPVARPRQKPRSSSVQLPPTPPIAARHPSEDPPPYVQEEPASSQASLLRPQPSAVSLRARTRGNSITNVLAGRPRSTSREPQSKVDWAESSEDEAIDIVAAGASGSQALDERTSATLSASRASAGLPPVLAQPPVVHTRHRSGTLRRNRPSNLDLSLALPAASMQPPPSPAPTLLSLRQALAQSASLDGDREGGEEPTDPALGEDDEGDETDGRISLAQALLESRLPELPPLGTTRPQEPILLATTNDRVESPPGSPVGNWNGRNTQGTTDTSPSTSRRRRRRWSVLNINSNEGDSPQADAQQIPNPPLTAPATERSPHRFTRSHSFRSNRSQPASISTTPDPPSSAYPPSLSSQRTTTPVTNLARSATRYFPRIISNAFHGRRSEERAALPAHASDSETTKPSVQSSNQAPPPKLEYVKLPGTKNALMIKAVETAKKSFLAILCGDNGEKVELFAGTYRTALGLSRTFILPDSPRSLELQLQGDDLVEVFLVFAQNVFGLEPATVRVREVRIGRAERRAARRRARENNRTGTGENAAAPQEGEPPEEDVANVNVTVGVSVAVESTPATSGAATVRPASPTLVASEHPNAPTERPATPVDSAQTASTSQLDDLPSVTSANAGPYTTFQQLSFAPKFPLASIADDYIIPPTYPSFIEYRKEYEHDEATNSNDGNDTNNEPPPADFSPPGLPVPIPTKPPQWYYRDPKGVVHGPWKSSLMQAWYKQGLLPPDLPIRREEDEEFTLLKELRLQSVDPAQPFSFPPTPPPPPPVPPPPAEKPLLSPISLLAQPRHFGPPALFFSSRGGHSTTVVDSRGRSVLKGKFVWTNDDDSEDSKVTSKMGDIKRLEAFDVQDRSVLVALRQGGLEAVDLCDALLRPADESRTVLPHYSPPLSTTNRRPPFVWKIGTPIAASPTPFSALTSQRPKTGFGHLSGRKSSVSSGKTVVGRSDVHTVPGDLEPTDEVFFVGRKEDEIYFCERNAGSFRILRLAPQ
ncbi:hypothetical protein CC2G_000978 [Coprinopsis cinerea AmutBmut pab1-1]|nr:hypothetical protein CC2G_000978 [Coprinopsis cinerea AmutBmut pab1-1]